MDITNIASTGAIEVDAVTLVKSMRRAYIRYAFRADVFKGNGGTVKKSDTGHDLHYPIYDKSIDDYCYYIEPLTDEQSKVMDAFDIIADGMKDL